MMIHTKYQGSRPYGFRQEDFFSCFPVKHVVPVAGPFLAPWGIIKRNLEPLLGDALYQISMFYVLGPQT